MRFAPAKNFTLAAALIVVGVSATAAQKQTTTPQIVSAANAFLHTLDETQRQHVMYAFTDDAQRARWSNFPTGFVPRGGISLEDMTPPQQTAAMNLLSTVLSPRGLEKVQQIRQADDDFKTNGSKRVPRGGGPPPQGGQQPGGPAGPVARATAAPLAERCSALTSTTSRSSERRPKQLRGCFSSEVTTSHSTSPSPEARALSLRV